MKQTLFLVAGGLLFSSVSAWGQGQDSEAYERDLMVIATLLEGGFDNANQSYFDVRGDRSTKHRRVHTTVSRTSDDDYRFSVTGYWDGDPTKTTDGQIWILSADDAAAAVRMQMWQTSATPAGEPGCTVYWRREAAQFRATGDRDCGAEFASELVLSEKQLWMTFSGDAGDYQMHRIRNFECYADIPGVGGGRNIPYERYDDFRIHDQGGAVWFDAKDGRRLGISLFLVDWPINNYVGVFTRDSFVIYVSEEIDGERKEHGYAFTVPDADRIGINLKWMLASCFMKSNADETPFM